MKNLKQQQFNNSNQASSFMCHQATYGTEQRKQKISMDFTELEKLVVLHGQVHVLKFTKSSSATVCSVLL